MGVVYRARDLKLDQEIALKRIRPDRVSPERRETLRREIILSRRVTHPNVCRVYDVAEIAGEEFVSMEYIAGPTLKDMEERERMLPLGRGLAIAKGICGGLAAAHRIGVLHRDLKPENVIVGEDGEPRLMDFGIAIESALYTGEAGDTVPGTPQFLAPELLQGAIDIDEVGQVVGIGDGDAVFRKRQGACAAAAFDGSFGAGVVGEDSADGGGGSAEEVGAAVP